MVSSVPAFAIRPRESLMTRKDVLTRLIRHSRANGFEFRKWFQANIEPQWTSFENAINVLDEGRRYYALLFSHEFAQHFWKAGEQLTFIVPASDYVRHNAQGKIITVKRKPYMRRTTKADVWLYHLREMAATEEPLRYVRRFMLTLEDLRPKKVT